MINQQHQQTVHAVFIHQSKLCFIRFEVTLGYTYKMIFNFFKQSALPDIYV